MAAALPEVCGGVKVLNYPDGFELRLERKGSQWEIPSMHAVKVDDARRIRLKVLNPGDYYAPDFVSADEITLRRVERPRRSVKFTKAEALRAIRKSKLTFTRSWETMRQETREF